MAKKVSAVNQQINFVVLLNNRKENVDKFRETLEGHTDKFIVEDRFPELLVDRADEIKQNYKFCKLGITIVKSDGQEIFDNSFVDEKLDSCDCVIFINSLEEGNTKFLPLCMALFNIYETKVELYDNETAVKKFMDIKVICSDQNYSQCGRYLMERIKYIAYLLGCSEIRLESVYDRNTYKFYERTNFNKIPEEGTEHYYDHYYVVSENDGIYKPLPAMKGSVNLVSQMDEEPTSTIFTAVHEPTDSPSTRPSPAPSIAVESKGGKKPEGKKTKGKKTKRKRVKNKKSLKTFQRKSKHILGV